MVTSQYIVTLSKEERRVISQLIAEGENPVYNLTHAKILLLADTNGEWGGMGRCRDYSSCRNKSFNDQES